MRQQKQQRLVLVKTRQTFKRWMSLYRCFRHRPVEAYHQQGVADGMAFATNRGYLCRQPCGCCKIWPYQLPFEDRRTATSPQRLRHCSDAMHSAKSVPRFVLVPCCPTPRRRLTVGQMFNQRPPPETHCNSAAIARHCDVVNVALPRPPLPSIVRCRMMTNQRDPATHRRGATATTAAAAAAAV